MNKQAWQSSIVFIMVFALLAPPPVSARSGEDTDSHLSSTIPLHATAANNLLSQDWLSRFNYYRQAAGLPVVTEIPQYSADLAQHINYMLLNVPSEGLWHGETPGLPGYTAVGDQAARESNLFWFPSGALYGGDPAMAMDSWMGSIHHRYGMLNPDLATTGFAFGCDALNCGSGLNVIRGINWGSNPRPNGIFYPGINQKGVNTDIILTWQFHSTPTVMLKTASLKDQYGQSAAFTTTSPSNGDYFNMVSIKPADSLDLNTTYTASITVQLEAGLLSQTWSFKTLTFPDVPIDHWAWKYIEGLYGAGVTGGCSTSPMMYCPSNPMSRAQMAIFLLRAKHGSNYTPPPATPMFTDVPITDWAAPWIEELANEGITGGCSIDPRKYCPDATITRAQMAVFLLRAKHGSDYHPPAAAGMFADVPADSWVAPWIEQLANEGITGGCGGGNYCPAQAITRDQMAVFLVRAFTLPAP